MINQIRPYEPRHEAHLMIDEDERRVLGGGQPVNVSKDSGRLTGNSDLTVAALL